LSDLCTSNNTLNSILNVTGTRRLGMSEVFQMQQYIHYSTIIQFWLVIHIIIIMKRKLNHKKGIITSLVLKRIS